MPWTGTSILNNSDFPNSILFRIIIDGMLLFTVSSDTFVSTNFISLLFPSSSFSLSSQAWFLSIPTMYVRTYDTTYQPECIGKGSRMYPCKLFFENVEEEEEKEVEFPATARGLIRRDGDRPETHLGSSVYSKSSYGSSAYMYRGVPGTRDSGPETATMHSASLSSQITPSILLSSSHILFLLFLFFSFSWFIVASLNLDDSVYCTYIHPFSEEQSTSSSSSSLFKDSKIPWDPYFSLFKTRFSLSRISFISNLGPSRMSWKKNSNFTCGKVIFISFWGMFFAESASSTFLFSSRTSVLL